MPRRCQDRIVQQEAQPLGERACCRKIRLCNLQGFEMPSPMVISFRSSFLPLVSRYKAFDVSCSLRFVTFFSQFPVNKALRTPQSIEPGHHHPLTSCLVSSHTGHDALQSIVFFWELPLLVSPGAFQYS